MNGNEQRIREIAFYLWEQEGYPDGEAERHWHIAKAMIEKEDAERRDQEGEPPGDRAEIEQAADTPIAKNTEKATRNGSGIEEQSVEAASPKPSRLT